MTERERKIMERFVMAVYGLYVVLNCVLTFYVTRVALVVIGVK